jgi:hypothetical protein
MAKPRSASRDSRRCFMLTNMQKKGHPRKGGRFLLMYTDCYQPGFWVRLLFLSSSPWGMGQRRC